MKEAAYCSWICNQTSSIFQIPPSMQAGFVCGRKQVPNSPWYFKNFKTVNWFPSGHSYS